MPGDLNAYLTRTETYLREKLLPFWIARAVEPRYGGFQTNYDRNGRRTSVTEKTLLCQGRCIFALSHAARLGFDWPGSRAMISQGIDFLLRHFRDPEYDGYYWIVEEDGRPKDMSKVVYGHSFLVYALAEHALLTGEDRSRKEAVRLADLLLCKAADVRYGGFCEHFDRQFKPIVVREDGQVNKSLDVHMHLMEALTALYELTRDPRHRQLLEQIIALIFDRMTDPKSGTGISMFLADWTPIPNVQLGTVWGSDRFAKEKTVEITSYGHNIELAWLCLHAQEILGIPRETSLARVRPIFEHTCEKGVDWECGGLFVEGFRDGQVTETNKEFWQQAEALVGFLDACLLTGQEKYFQAFQNIHDFVFTKVINWEQGEWFPLLDRQGNVLWDYMGHNWKICYHTVRATCLTVRKLRELASAEVRQLGKGSMS